MRVRPGILVLLFVLFFELAGLAQPSISSFSPAYGWTNDPNFITINGSGFAPGPLVVKFNGVQAPATATSSSVIQTRVAYGTPVGTGKIFVSVNGNTTFSAQNFTVTGPGPYVNSFSPTTGSAGSVVTLTGLHLTGTTSVKFNGTAGTGLNVQSDTQIQVTAPPGVTSGPLLVTGSSGTYSTSTNATTTSFYVSPVITGFSPFHGRAGTNVVITGTNLLGTTEVDFGSSVGTGLVVLSNNAVQATVPAGAQTGVITLIAPAGAQITSSNFVVLPTVSGFSPSAGGSGTSVVISGANLQGVTSILFNGASAAFSGASYNQVSTTVPPGATSGPITVTTSDGSFVTTNFYVPANITSFTPSAGAPGTSVKITGVNFTNATAVTFSGVAASSFVVTNNTTIGAIVPGGVTTGPISITTPAGMVTTTTNFFVAPSISGFTPTHGLPGTNVVITGNNFLGATVVKFNGTPASFTPPSGNTSLTAIVPAGATTGPITVGTPGGTNTSTAIFTLDFTSDLSVSVFAAPSPIFIGSNLVYTLNIINSGPFAAPNVTLTNMLAASVTLISTSTSQGSLSTSAGAVIGALGSLGSGGNATVTITVKPTVAGNITNTAWVTSDYNDPNTANNTNSLVTTVLPLPFLSIQKSGTTLVKVGWSVLLTNYTLQAATNLRPSITWSNVSGTPAIVGSSNFMTLGVTNSQNFFRLKQNGG
jgi:hypothetical protein